MFGAIGLAISAASLPMSSVSVPTSAQSSAVSAAGMGQTANQQNSSSQENAGRQEDDPFLKKFHLIARAVSDDKRGVDGAQVFLREGRLVLGAPATGDSADGHPFSGFYVEYPFRKASDDVSAPRGLVSTISFDPPNLNWIFVRRDTMTLSYGNKTTSLPHITDPWGFTTEGRWLTLGGERAGFVAVRDAASGSWVLHYDVNDDLLSSCVTCAAPASDRVEVDLERRLTQ
jgi:hypothetical protein